MNEEQLKKILADQTAQIIAYVDKRFDDVDKSFGEIDRRFGDVDKRFAEQDDQFARLYNHTEQRFNELDAKLNAKADKADVDRILDTMDGLVHRLETDAQERAALTAQVDRHERWINRAASTSR